MSFDLSRINFDARRDFHEVILQQGRVQLDSDWNEWVAQLSRRLQAGSLDGLNGTVVPRTTPNGFEIKVSGGRISIGPGRIYVDGLLAENHGAPPDQWDPRLEELAGVDPIPYEEQPYQPYLKDSSYIKQHLGSDAGLPEKGQHLIYLDVWRRDVTALQDPGLIEPAVGSDTTGRRQTVWQVKVLPNENGVAISCASKEDEIPGWKEILAPVSVRLSTHTGDSELIDDRCDVAPNADYTGLENQLYRVEVHDAGTADKATLKWSRDNGIVASRVSHLDPARQTLTVESLKKDDYLCFRPGSWVEVTDDWCLLAGRPGELCRIKQILPETHQLELDRALPAGLFPTDAEQKTDALRNTLVRQWDNDPLMASGALPLPGKGEKLPLEQGIAVEFFHDPPGGLIPTGTHWVFAARSGTASIPVPLVKAPPLGTHHHYARLAVVDFSTGGVTDCRTLWPPQAQGGCDCSVCVTAEGHNQGTATLQQAINRVKESGGTVCLGAGRYDLDEPISVVGARSLRIRGQGWATQLIARVPGPVLAIADGNGVTVENLTLMGSAANADLPTSMLLARNVVDLRVERCNLLGLESEGGTSVGIGLNGTILGATIRHCAIAAGWGLGRVPVLGQPGFVLAARGVSRELVSAELRLENCVLVGRQRGVSLDDMSFHLGHTLLRHNVILVASAEGSAGVVALGGVLPKGDFRIEANLIDSAGDGVQAGVDGLVITANTIVGNRSGRGDGLRLLEGLDPRGPRRVTVEGNRIEGFQRHGIHQTFPLGHLLLRGNQVERMGAGGLVMAEAATAEHLVCEGNHFSQLGLGQREGNVAFAAVQLMAVRQAELRGNAFDDVAPEARSITAVDAVRVLAVGDLQLVDNRFEAIGPPEGIGQYHCLRVAIPFDRVAIRGNRMLQRNASERPGLFPSWGALLVGPDLDRSVRYRPFAAILLDPGRPLSRPGTVAWLLTEHRLAAVERGARDASIEANTVEAVASSAPLMSTLLAGHVRLAGNVLRRQDPEGSPMGLLVELSGDSISATDNLLMANPQVPTMRLQPVARRAAIVMGNTSSGRFSIDDNLSIPVEIDLTNLIGV